MRKRYVVVEYESIDDDRRYRVIPLDSKKRRRGDAVWMRAHLLESTGERSNTASLKTYRANESLIDRGCTCQCCIHEAYDPWEWNNWGKWRSPDEPGAYFCPGSSIALAVVTTPLPSLLAQDDIIRMPSCMALENSMPSS